MKAVSDMPQLLQLSPFFSARIRFVESRFVSLPSSLKKGLPLGGAYRPLGRFGAGDFGMSDTLALLTASVGWGCVFCVAHIALQLVAGRIHGTDPDTKWCNFLSFCLRSFCLKGNQPPKKNAAAVLFAMATGLRTKPGTARNGRTT